MTLHAASREALGLAETRLGEVVGETGTDPSAVGEELLAVVTLLDSEVGLRRALADGTSDPQARTRMLRGLLDDKVSEPSLRVLDAAVGNRWSSPRELVDGVESLGRSALLSSAERAGNIDEVERQLFRLARVVIGSQELDRALSDQAAPAEAKRTLVRTLVASKVDPVVQILVEQVVQRLRGRGIGKALDSLVALAAERRERSVAQVTSASPLSDEQRQHLSDRLRQIYGRPIALHVEIDAALGGGLIIKVGDEVIDGSASGRLAALRRQLA